MIMVRPIIKTLLVAVLFGCSASAADSPRPRLQVINASTETVDLFWLPAEGPEKPSGTISPGKDLVIDTTLGHRFAVVARKSRTRQLLQSEVLVQGFRFDTKTNDGIPEFYTQRTEADGFPIVASETVNPYALKEAAYLIRQMLAKRTDIREAMIKSGARFCIIAHDEFTTDLPEFSQFADDSESPYPNVSPKDFWDARARGTGGSTTDPYCSCGEENLLGYPGDPYEKENILIHEFAHNIHLRGMSNIDPGFDDRLQAAYEKAMAAGLWKDKYAATNRFEYFAEGVQSWFDNNREDDHDHNHVNTRAELIEYDPGLAAFCKEVFGDTELSYTKPATRLTGHMKGYDPEKAPSFTWPERLKNARTAIRRNNVTADQN